VRRILAIPKEIVVVELLPLGYPRDPQPVAKSRLPIETIVRYESW
jgi:nitroreductase